MSLEQSFDRIATALELIAQKLGSAPAAEPSQKKQKAAPAADPASVTVTFTPPLAAEPTPAPAAPVTIEQIRAVGQKLITLGKKTEMGAVFTNAGGKLTTLPVTVYPDVLKALNELLPTA